MKHMSWSAVQKTGQRMAPDEAGIELHLPQLIRITSRTKVRHTRDFVVVTVPLTALFRKRWRSFSCGKRRSHEHSLSTTVSGTDELVGVERSRHRVDQELFARPRITTPQMTALLISTTASRKQAWSASRRDV